jgi:hypothetical protein
MAKYQRRTVGRAKAGKVGVELEPLEDRRMLAAAFLNNEVLVQFAPTATAAARQPPVRPSAAGPSRPSRPLRCGRRASAPWSGSRSAAA